MLDVRKFRRSRNRIAVLNLMESLHGSSLDIRQVRAAIGVKNISHATLVKWMNRLTTRVRPHTSCYSWLMVRSRHVPRLRQEALPLRD